MHLTCPARNEAKYHYFAHKNFFSKILNHYIAQKRLGILKIRLYIRIPRTRFSLTQRFLVINIP